MYLSNFCTITSLIWIFLCLVLTNSSAIKSFYQIGSTSNTTGNVVKCSSQEYCPKDINGKSCSGNGVCECSEDGIPNCNCNTNHFGNACQYNRQSMTCENVKFCVQCQVYGTGPFSEDNDCENFCREYHHPIITTVGKFILRKNDVFCSFIDSSNTTNCRYYFKLVNILSKSAVNYKVDVRDGNDVYIVAKKDQDCDLDGKFNFPNYIIDGTKDSILTQHLIDLSQSDEKQPNVNGGKHGTNSLTTLIIICIFVALPFVTCIASCLCNLKKLPCGLCNIFSRPSSRYLRNVRAYPGELPPA